MSSELCLNIISLDEIRAAAQWPKCTSNLSHLGPGWQDRKRVLSDGRLWGHNCPRCTPGKELRACREIEEFERPFGAIAERIAAMIPLTKRGYEVVLRVAADDLEQCAEFWRWAANDPPCNPPCWGCQPPLGLTLGLEIDGDRDLSRLPRSNGGMTVNPKNIRDIFAELPAASHIALWSGREPLTQVKGLDGVLMLKYGGEGGQGELDARAARANEARAACAAVGVWFEECP